jgi:hypothetical protein
MKKDGSIEKIYGREDPIKSDFELLPNPRAYDSEKENYEHFFAKLKLYDWLRAIQKDNIEKDRIIDVIHIEKENEAKDKIYLEFPVIYPYEGLISEEFIKNDNFKYIYPKIYPNVFNKSHYLNFNQRRKLIDILILFWEEDHEKYYSKNNIAKLMLSILKNQGIVIDNVYDIFYGFLDENFEDKDNRKNIAKIAIERLINDFYENNYNFEIPKDEDLWLEDVQKEILNILNKRIIYYLDLGIVHKEETRPTIELEILKHDIEIVNKSPVNIEKIKYLLNNINSDIPIIIIPSNIILQQYMMPNHLYGYIYYKNGWFLRKKTGDVEIDISSKKYRKLISFDDHGQRR